MVFEKLNSSVLEFAYIIHVADLHIRLTKRHAEYREVFKRLFDNISASPPDTVVCVLGDVCHSKSDLTPECVQMVSEFLQGIANLRETILVSGNHDATLSNKTRLDSLSPIVDALAHPKLHYLKESKLYGFGNILFNNMCIFDPVEKYILGKDIPEIYRSTYQHVVALFHGAVDRSITDTGFSMSNPSIMPELFDWHHMALLGDIHRRQNIQEAREDQHKPCVHYPGSLIQQNHGEPLHPHGYTLWNLNKDYSYQYKEVPNDYGYFTIEIHGAQILTDLTEVPKKTYLRVKCLDSIPSEVKAAEALVGTMTEVQETARIRVESEMVKKSKEKLVCKDVKLAEITNVDYQATLITEFLTEKLNVTDKDKIARILLINRETNAEIKKDDFARNLKWVPIKFEWDNMFTFGEGNVINFNKMNGVYGIFGPNTIGKSSIFSALCFCLFDKWERGFKAMVARNVAKNSFRCKFEFEITGVRYFIEKEAETTRSGNVKVNVKFWRVRNGVDEDLTDVMRRKTNDIIRDYVGTFEDFILTYLSIQTATKNNSNFIDMGNTERKDLLVQFIGLNIFDRLDEAAHEKAKELTAKLKPHKEKNYIADLENNEQKLTAIEYEIKQDQLAVADLTKQIQGVNDCIVEETGKLIKLDKDIPTDLPSLENGRAALSRGLETKAKKIGLDKTELEVRRVKMAQLADELSKINTEDLVKANQTYNEYRKKLTEVLPKFELKKQSVNHKLEKLEKLRKKYNYDPKCLYCVQNVDEKDRDARKTETELQSEQAEIDTAAMGIVTLRTRMEEWKWVETAYQSYTDLLNNHSKAKDAFSTLHTEILLAEKDVEKLAGNLKEVEEKINLYHKNQIALENNQKINMIILNFKNALNKLEVALHAKNKELQTLTGHREVTKNLIALTEGIIMDMMETEEKRTLYELYGKAVGRNGIPYHVICNTIPEITREANSILTQVTDFTLEIEYDDKNLTPYVNYENKGMWPIEMTSGFERFVASVAIRVALASVSNLPRTNMLLIDEGFSALDTNNIHSMHTLFSLLKSHYEIVIVISHLDVIKDFVDKTIEISQNGNFSKVEYN